MLTVYCPRMANQIRLAGNLVLVFDEKGQCSLPYVAIPDGLEKFAEQWGAELMLEKPAVGLEDRAGLQSMLATNPVSAPPALALEPIQPAPLLPEAASPTLNLHPEEPPAPPVTE